MLNSIWIDLWSVNWDLFSWEVTLYDTIPVQENPLEEPTEKYGKRHASYDDYNSFINPMFCVLTTVNLVLSTPVVSLNVLQYLCFHLYFFFRIFGVWVVVSYYGFSFSND